jgi:ribosomal protein S18 acetylase RimI-like enzyme
MILSIDWRVEIRLHISMTIELRQMTQQELEKYIAFSYQSFIEEVSKSSGKSIEEVKEFAGGPPSNPTANDIWRVICHRQEAIGFIWVQIFPERKEAFGFDIFIEEKHRSCGIGRYVMESCRALLKSKGIKTVDICVFEHNQIARALYTSLGFEEKSYNKLKKQYRLQVEV